MKPNRKHRKLRITEADYMLGNRRASRLLEIQEHGKPVPLRSVAHKSKKVYDRKRLKRTGINEDGCPFYYADSSVFMDNESRLVMVFAWRPKRTYRSH